ncbi:hypothetical protein C8Q80DRAFT_831463 [Daedaleopsis nitida]|nr:hypothetical protein C8Q80DRAFT_831463 [Daedaleopsis nitida]
MDGSDDFFDDDLVLDDTTLAAIEAAEQKWQEQQQQQQQQERLSQRRPLASDAPLPQPKKQKTTHSTGLDGLTAAVQRASVADDYEEELPDISIVGDGSYKLPADQRASANELAAQMRGHSLIPSGASFSNRVPPVPGPSRGPPPRRPPVPAQSTHPQAPPFNRHPSSGSSSTVSGSGQSQGPSTSARSQNRPRHSTLSTIQAALADFVPPPTHPPPQPTAPQNDARNSRASPAPGTSRPSLNASRNTRNSFSSFTAARPQVQRPAVVPSAPPRNAARGTSPSVSVPVDRRSSVAGPSRQRLVSPVAPPQPPPLQHHHPPLSQGQQERDLRIELETLKAQVEELVKAQQKAVTELEEAKNVRYAKEGEVSILRKSIEKTAKDHAAEVARIKSAKAEAEAAQQQIRKEMREELERVKTQYMFKQHELETARNKTPWTVRTKRVDHHPPPTPVSASTQRRQSQAALSGDGDDTMQTPVRSKGKAIASVSPKRQPRNKIIHVPESPPKTRKRSQLQFQCAFDSAPLPAPPPPLFSQNDDSVLRGLSQASQSTQVNGKVGKGKQRADVVVAVDDAQNEDLFFNPPPSADARHLFSPRSHEERVFVLPDVDDLPPPPAPSAPTSSSSTGPLHQPPFTVDVDVVMQDGEQEAVAAEPAEPVEPPEPLEPLLELDWSRELQRIVLTHKHHATRQPTLQFLIDHPLPAAASSDQVKAYNAACAKLLDMLGTLAVKMAEVDEVVRDVVDALCDIGAILCALHSIPQLAAVLDLLKIAALFIPAFVSIVLSPSGQPGSANAAPVILALACTAVRELLIPGEEGLDDAQNGLAAETLGLLEALSWDAPPDLALRLTVFFRTANVLSVLINKDQPAWLLTRTLRVFALIASYQDLRKQFLTFPITEDREEETRDREYSRIPHIERLAAILNDPRFDGSEGRALKLSILRFVTSLFLIRGLDSDARDILLCSETLVPSIVLFLMTITAPLYEEDEEFLTCRELASWTVNTLIHAVVVIYHLFQASDDFTLRQKLTRNKKRIFNGLFHMFTVSLGRIGYASASDAVGPENLLALEKARDMARDVLEMVVDGPELESIWEVFQGGPAPRIQHQSDTEA